MTPPELVPGIFLIFYWFGPSMNSTTGAIVWLMFVLSEFAMLYVYWSSLSILQIQASMSAAFVAFAYVWWADRSTTKAAAAAAQETAEAARKTAEAAATRIKADADSKERAFKAREKEMLAELHAAQTALRAKEGKVEELVSRLPAADAAGPQT
jgi:hypothetical protein